MGKIKLYDPDKTHLSFMQFGFLTSGRKRYEYDKRTKKYGNKREHKGYMGKYQKNDKEK